MLVIRLSRTGRRNQPTYRIVVAEKNRPVKGKFIEVVGFYNQGEGKKTDFKKDRIEHWIAQGAHPSDSVAGLLKYNGLSGMEKFMDFRNKTRAKKNAPAE